MDPTTIPPDLQKSLIKTIYLTFIHNYVPLGYLMGIIVSLAISIYRPSRFSILLFIGFAVLLFGFEYDKHIVAGLREQTLNSLTTEIAHNKFQKLLSLIISDLMPIFFYITGWLFIYIAIIYGGIKINQKNK